MSIINNNYEKNIAIEYWDWQSFGFCDSHIKNSKPDIILRLNEYNYEINQV